MRLSIIAVLGLSAWAQSVNPKTPAPIPADRHEALSRQMLELQRDQLAIMQMRETLIQAQLKMQEKQHQYDAVIDALKKELHVDPSCDVTTEKTWSCPPPKPAAK